MRRIIGWTALAAVLLCLPLGAQVRTAYPEQRGLQLSQFPRIIKLADNVYGYEEIREPGFTTVSLFVVGASGVLVADGQGSPDATRKMVEMIATITPKPIRWYVVASDHGDHTAGNSVLAKDITYIVHANSRAIMMQAAANPNRQAGSPPVVVPAVAMAGDKQVIDIGGIEVQALFLGRAHTGGDLVVYLPQQKILFMSEVYLNRVFPALRSAYPSEWVAVIDKALAMNVDRFVPGHGFIEEPKASREELVEYRKAMQAVIAETTRLHALKLSADAAVKQADWGSYAGWFLREQQAPIAVRKIYDEIDGKLK